MIDTMLSVSEIQTDLKRIMDDINEELHKHIPIDPGSVDGDMKGVCCIVITCRDGTRVSPCYVEKLYEEYSHRSPISELKLERKHLHLYPNEGKEPSNGKLFVWQRTKIPLNVCKFEDLTIGRLWTTFPFHVTSTIEEGFRNNPLNRKFELLNSRTQYVFNFETGEMYSGHRNKMFRFRCTVSVIDDRITCKMLGSVSYKSLAKHYSAAGILFYSAHPITAEPVFLLGHMTYACESWCDFGGIKNFRYNGSKHQATRLTSPQPPTPTPNLQKKTDIWSQNKIISNLSE